MTDRSVPPDVLYEMRVAAHLRYEELADRLEWPPSVLDDHINDFIEDEVRGYEYGIEQREEIADLHEEAFEAPAYLLDSLAALSTKIRELERFRDRLIAFARSYAVDPESMRVIATATGLSHTTVMRFATDSATRKVASFAGPIAEDILTGLTPREDPDLYARLSKIATQARQETRS